MSYSVTKRRVVSRDNVKSTQRFTRVSVDVGLALRHEALLLAVLHPLLHLHLQESLLRLQSAGQERSRAEVHVTV